MHYEPPQRLRSLLFVPGLGPDQIEKADKSNADAVCIDLEDGDSADRKDEARGVAVAALGQPPHLDREMMVRINPIHTTEGLHDILALIGCAKITDSIMIPKVRSPDEFRILDRLLGSVQSRTVLSPIIETADGLESAFAIANGVDAIDVLFLQIDDHDGLTLECAESAALGFTGNACIHPNHIAIIRNCFRPTGEQIIWAKRVSAALAASPNGLAILNGELIEIPVLRAANHTLALAQQA